MAQKAQQQISSFARDSEENISIGGIKPYRLLFDTLEDGAYNFYKSVRALPNSDPTVDIAHDNDAKFVNLVFDAMKTLPPSLTPYQRGMVNTLDNFLKNLDDKDELLTSVAHLVVICVLDLHKYGDNLRPDQIKRLNPTPEDLNMTAVQRLNHLCEVFKRTKKVCTHLFTGKDAITKIVAGPVAYENAVYDKDMQDRPPLPVVDGLATLPSPDPPLPDRLLSPLRTIRPSLTGDAPRPKRRTNIQALEGNANAPIGLAPGFYSKSLDPYAIAYRESVDFSDYLKRVDELKSKNKTTDGSKDKEAGEEYDEGRDENHKDEDEGDEDGDEDNEGEDEDNEDGDEYLEDGDEDMEDDE